jgi:hypothetical protein
MMRQCHSNSHLAKRLLLLLNRVVDRL